MGSVCSSDTSNEFTNPRALGYGRNVTTPLPSFAHSRPGFVSVDITDSTDTLDEDYSPTTPSPRPLLIASVDPQPVPVYWLISNALHLNLA